MISYVAQLFELKHAKCNQLQTLLKSYSFFKILVGLLDQLLIKVSKK